MKIQIENLKAQMQGRDLNIYQKADALIEFNKLLEYVEELEQLSIYRVVERSEQLCQHQWHKHPSHPKIGAMLCRKCGTELA